MAALNLFNTALRGLLANKLRAALTALGIIIGVASIISMLALGNGARAAVQSSFRGLGSDEVVVSARAEFDEGELVEVGKILSYEDGLLMADAVELVDSVDMEVGGTAKLRHGRASLDDQGVLGTTAGALQGLIRDGNLQPVDWPAGEPITEESLISQGRFFSPAEVISAADVCVLGYETAFDLFAGDDPLDQTIWINRQRCVVIGIMTELETTNEDDRYSSQPNDGVYMPISTAIRMFYEEEPSVRITAHVTDENRMDEAKTQISAYLRERHEIQTNSEGEYEDDFNLTTSSDILGAQQEAARTFALLLAAMAAVSLVVGGIGIMNVMLVSVTERTREIGVRMAVGARPIDVVLQFLVESAALSAGGGLLGVVLGVLSIPVAASLNQGVALLDLTSIPLALGLALLAGIGFGLYPALRAANLDPIEALRYE